MSEETKSKSSAKKMRSPVPASQLNPSDYRMPAEWEPHASCWIGYPETTENWPEEAVPAQKCFTAFCKALAEFEPVNLCVSSSELWPKVADEFKDSPVRVLELSQDDCWFRDQAPTFVVPRSGRESANLPPVVGVCWEFDGYAGIIPDVKHDKMIAPKICRLERVPSFHPGVVLEGGSIHVDGLGTLMTTEQCLLKKNVLGKLRNPHLDKKGLEELFARFLGITKVLWIPRGIHSDLVTNGHVDNLSCFLKPGVVALHWADKDEDSDQHAISEEAYKYLSKATDASGRSLEVVKILRPRQLLRRKDECSPPSGVSKEVDKQKSEPGEPIHASYINFFMLNGGAIIPQFGDEERDRLALETYRTHLSPRRVIGMPARAVIVGGGCFHCITMQQPEEA